MSATEVAATPTAPSRGASANLLAGNRLFLQQGPINLIIKAYGDDDCVRDAYSNAYRAFNGLLAALVEDLPTLKKPLERGAPQVGSATAQRMVTATTPYSQDWVTPMAAVAGAIADEVAQNIAHVAGLEKLFVNNGGDVALWLAAGESLDIGIVPSLARAMPESSLKLHSADEVKGVATSGWDGHSFSLGIADAVTVLASSAADADVAATMIANAVDVEHPAIERRPANELDPDSDLGERRVTTAVHPLPPQAVATALDRGAGYAKVLVERGLIKRAFLSLQGSRRAAGPMDDAENSR